MKQQVIIAVGVTLLIFGGAIGYGLYSDTLRKPFDATEWLGKSLETARNEHPDAKLIEVTAEAVTSDGKVHLEQRGHLIARFRYVPTAADVTPQAIPGARVGSTAQGGCTGGVVRTRIRSGVKQGHFEHAWSTENQKCLPELAGPPKCSFQQIWQKAKAKGAPDPAFADIDLAQEVGGGGSELRWRFEIVDRPDLSPPVTVFHAEFPDDC